MKTATRASLECMVMGAMGVMPPPPPPRLAPPAPVVRPRPPPPGFLSNGEVDPDAETYVSDEDDEVGNQNQRILEVSKQC